MRWRATLGRNVDDLFARSEHEVHEGAEKLVGGTRESTESDKESLLNRVALEDGDPVQKVLPHDLEAVDADVNDDSTLRDIPEAIGGEVDDILDSLADALGFGDDEKSDAPPEDDPLDDA